MSQEILEFPASPETHFCSVALGLDKPKKLTIPAQFLLDQFSLSSSPLKSRRNGHCIPHDYQHQCTVFALFCHPFLK
jgi:hypothetical protein